MDEKIKLGNPRMKKRSKKVDKTQSNKYKVAIPGMFVDLDVYKADFGDPADRNHEVHDILDPATNQKVKAVFMPKRKAGYYEGEISLSNKVQKSETLDDDARALRNGQVDQSYCLHQQSFAKDLPKPLKDAQTFSESSRPLPQPEQPDHDQETSAMNHLSEVEEAECKTELDDSEFIELAVAMQSREDSEAVEGGGLTAETLESHNHLLKPKRSSASSGAPKQDPKKRKTNIPQPVPSHADFVINGSHGAPAGGNDSSSIQTTTPTISSPPTQAPEDMRSAGRAVEAEEAADSWVTFLSQGWCGCHAVADLQMSSNAGGMLLKVSPSADKAKWSTTVKSVSPQMSFLENLLTSGKGKDQEMKSCITALKKAAGKAKKAGTKDKPELLSDLLRSLADVVQELKNFRSHVVSARVGTISPQDVQQGVTSVVKAWGKLSTLSRKSHYVAFPELWVTSWVSSALSDTMGIFLVQL